MNYLDDWDTELVEDMLTEMEKNFCELRRLLNKCKPGTEPRLHLQICEVIDYLRRDMMRRGKQRVLAMVPTLRQFVDLQIQKYRSHNQFNPSMLGKLSISGGRGRGSRQQSSAQGFSGPALRGSGLSMARMRPPMRSSSGSRPMSSGARAMSEPIRLSQLGMPRRDDFSYKPVPVSEGTRGVINSSDSSRSASPSLHASSSVDGRSTSQIRLAQVGMPQRDDFSYKPVPVSEGAGAGAVITSSDNSRSASPSLHTSTSVDGRFARSRSP